VINWEGMKKIFLLPLFSLLILFVSLLDPNVALADCTNNISGSIMCPDIRPVGCFTTRYLCCTVSSDCTGMIDQGTTRTSITDCVVSLQACSDPRANVCIVGTVTNCCATIAGCDLLRNSGVQTPPPPNCIDDNICKNTNQTCCHYSRTVSTALCPSGQQCVGTAPAGSGGDPSCSGNALSINTAIGCIPFGSREAFLGFILKWAVGIGGGIAFLLIIYAGFMIMTSAGNPERLKAGQELLTSAISGLILLIFSVVILKIIGVDILGLDSFGFN
jgi:hypothetical protein